MFTGSCGNDETLNFLMLPQCNVSTTWHLAQSLLKRYSGNLKRTVSTD